MHKPHTCILLPIKDFNFLFFSLGCLDDDEMKVSVMLNGEESMMEFIEIEDSKVII